ncbi:PEP-CTERM sorting domain-containing protein [Paucibacter sp. Y2R2-4]|uniref:PEP-CTERM sorting domain-containing protein n=1 Tax=Paucibacter sp. Y2R2-4 TaxID=2893553 RepID=UPI0021E3D888|nr:PEP-CTERM sorting domain-containing protein [Paucibacter sp. Y2R2-4]MCV2351426.1 PEP-CTERM sorting domain-containing protein [Paucibacter sp. Y2R2-4]
MIAVPKSALICTSWLLAAASAHASQQTVAIAPNGTLQASSLSDTITNTLTLMPGVTGFNFSGATGSYSSVKSDNNFFYAAYLIQTSAAVAQSITTTLNNVSGVTGLSERIYAYNGAFLGDAKAGPGIIQAWSTDIDVYNSSISIVAPVSLSAGSYVVEIRGKSIGNFGGSISMTSAVPEPSQTAMFLAGIGAIGLLLLSRSRKRD